LLWSLAVAAVVGQAIELLSTACPAVTVKVTVA
jgi:hypothetical protein